MSRSIRTHLAVSRSSRYGTLTTTLCGAMSGKSEDGMNSSEDRSEVNCLSCKRIMGTPSSWRHRTYLKEGG